MAVATCLTGCTGREPSDATAFRVGLESAPATLDPRYATDAHGVRILPLIFNGLLKKEITGEFTPDLALSWENPEPLTHRFRLRNDVRFQDGSFLTADDVVATYRYVMDPANGCPSSGSFKSVSAVKAVDSMTVVFDLSEPFVSLPFKLTMGILPARLAVKKDLGGQLVGTGPYRLATFRPGEEVTLKANANHFRSVPEVETLRFRILPNATTRLLEMRSGGLDLLQNAVPPYSLKFLDRSPGVKVVHAPGTSYQYLGYNFTDPIVGKSVVRKAISHALDRRSLIDHVMAGSAREATGLLVPTHWAYAPDVVTYGHDPELAKKLLDGAGFPDPDGDGPAVRFTLSYKTSTDKTANEAAKVIADQLSRIGVGVEVRSFEWGTFFSDVKKGNFQMYSLRWIGIDDPDIFHYIFHSDSMPPNGANRGRYFDAEVDGWIETSRVEPDMENRRELYGKIQRKLADDCVYTSLWWVDNVAVMSEGYEGFEVLPGGEYTNLANLIRREARSD